MYLQSRRNICNQIYTFLFGPPAYEHEEIRLGILLNTSPFLRLALVLWTQRFCCRDDLHILCRNSIVIQSLDIARIRIGQ
jgi:hypothetical protein